MKIPLRSIFACALLAAAAAAAFGRAPSLETYLQAGDEIGLTDTQRGQVRAAELHLRKTVLMKEAEMRVAEIDLEELLDRESPEPAQLEAQLRRIADLRVQIELARLSISLRLKGMLRPEQLEKARRIEARRAREEQERRVEIERLAQENRRRREQFGRLEQALEKLKAKRAKVREPPAR